MSRLIFGPGLDWSEPPHDLAAASIQTLSLRGVRPGGLVDLTLGPLGPGVAPLLNVFAAYLAGPLSMQPGPEAALAASGYKGLLESAALAAGGDVTVQVSPAPVQGVNYWVQTILEVPD